MITKEQSFGMYLGQQIYIDSNLTGKTRGTLKGINKLHTNKVISNYGLHDINICKLILRPLSEMTEEENKIRTGLMINDDGIEYDTFESTEYLLEKGFDIFDLHSRGWAVYESELKGEKK